MRTIEPARSYNAKFYRELEAAQQSSVEVLPIIFEVLRPSRVVDVGCGTGHWLATARDLGAKEILGIDGPWVEKEQLVIPAENFRIEDLTRPLKLDRRFDLALCFEVAEHLRESKAHTFVKTLCETADVVAFSAAIPGQGGRRHLNEQWPAYWADLFRELEYDCYDYLRPRIWNNPRVTWYYAQNSLIFAKRGSSSEFGAPVRPWAMVHPGLWSAEVARMKHPGKLLERFVKSVLRRATSDNKHIL